MNADGGLQHIWDIQKEWRGAEDGGLSRCREGYSRVEVLGSRRYVDDRVQGYGI